MSSSANIHDCLGRWFETISLDDLNRKAEMLERLDNKYVVDAQDLRVALKAFAEHFDVLEINGKHSFVYDTCYFDDSRVSCYRHHLQGRRNRAKVRMRRYLGTDLCFVEVKLKSKRGVTVKKRLACDPERFGELDSRALDFVNREHIVMYGRPFDCDFARVIEMRYQRTTLVAKDAGERMTIDSRLEFHREGNAFTLDPSVYILETKSAKGHGLADSILRSQHLHPTQNCSKYCAGIALLFQGMKSNKFLPALRKLTGADAGARLQLQLAGRV
jgi:VTC domain